MGSRCRVVYDFAAQPGAGELTISTDEILTVLKKDIGGGWWEGVNCLGQQGLFPLSYVEEIDDEVTNTVPPPPSATGHHDPFSTNTMANAIPQITATPPTAGNVESYDADEWDDDWDDDDDDSQVSHADTASNTGGNSGKLSHSASQQAISGKSQVPVRKSINRFSTFVKSGGEDFILGNKTKIVSEADKTYMTQQGSDIIWSSDGSVCTCTVSEPKKSKKYSGFKSYVEYQVVPSFTDVAVSRRYKHFDWLYCRLEEKFMTIPIPPLPAKQISGRFAEEFVEQRRIQLQMWINRICKHPVISRSKVWNHFLTCPPDDTWKKGKRAAERDEFVGGSFFYTLQTYDVAPNALDDVESKTEHFGRFVNRMDEAVKGLLNLSIDVGKKYSGPYKREMERISSAINHLANSIDPTFDIDLGLTSAMRNTGSTYAILAQDYDSQRKQDFEPLSYILHEYRGILSEWPAILQINRGAVNKKKEYLKFRDEGKVDPQVAESVSQRADTVTMAVLAEMEHFQKMRVQDCRQMMKDFLTAQITFYEGMASKLRDALQRFD